MTPRRRRSCDDDVLRATPSAAVVTLRTGRLGWIAGRAGVEPVRARLAICRLIQDGLVFVAAEWWHGETRTRILARTRGGDELVEPPGLREIRASFRNGDLP